MPRYFLLVKDSPINELRRLLSEKIPNAKIYSVKQINSPALGAFDVGVKIECPDDLVNPLNKWFTEDIHNDVYSAGSLLYWRTL